MAETLIVAAFNTEAGAEAAIRQLEAGGISSGTIRRYAKTTGAPAHTPSEQSAGGFWDWVLGEESPQRDPSLYERAAAQGSALIAVPVTGEHGSRVTEILRRCNPTFLQEREQPAATG
ncbi:MAG: hypothetical protein JOY71_07840 [Acetobacteraceae bacterium]|nr:hypothetical protein [Acetobacteraceae bacterium]